VIRGLVREVLALARLGGGLHRRQRFRRDRRGSSRRDVPDERLRLLLAFAGFSSPCCSR
jgi:hypothetical protein